MELVQLGQSSLQASRIAFGAMALGSARYNQKRHADTIRAAIDAGITTIDTAPLYDLGLSEQTVARAIAGRRQDVQVFTKVGLRWDDPEGYGDVLFTTQDEHGQDVAVRRNSRPESIRVEVERSLRRLRIDVLDMVFVHMLDPHTPIADTMGALKDLRSEGKLRGIGVSKDYTAKHLLEAQRELCEVPLSAVQLHYNLLHRRHEEGVMPVAREHRIATLAHSPLEMGLLTGKLTPSYSFGPDDIRSQLPQFHPDNVRRVAAALQRGVEPVATRHAASMAQVVLAWILAQPGVSGVVVGASWPDQVRESAQAARLTLSSEELQAIECVFEHLQLDPYAGLGMAQRVYGRGQHLARGMRRQVARVAGRLAPERPVLPSRFVGLGR